MNTYFGLGIPLLGRLSLVARARDGGQGLMGLHKRDPVEE